MSREDDIQRIIDDIVNTTTEFWDNPNGGYEYSCPYCYSKVVVGCKARPTMKDINHSLDCIYLIAKDLNTGMKEGE